MPPGPVITKPLGAHRPERGGAPIIIPTVLHIYYDSLLLPLGVLHAQEVIAQCNRDLRGLNEDIAEVVPDFAGIVGDLQLELRLATIDENGACMSGIRYHQLGGPGGYTAHMQNTRGYLNIHSYPSTNSFANYPMPVSDPYTDQDFIVLSTYDAVFEPRALAHEVGHWFGLYHVWGNSNTPGTCGDDYILDTPITAGSQQDCNTDQAECEPGVVENVQNHMDYSACRIMFTQGQAEHVIAVANDPDLVRAGLHAPENHAATGVFLEPGCPMTTGIRYRVAERCGASEVTFRAMAENQLPDSVHWSFPGGSPDTETNDHVLVTYTATGTYTATLTACRDGACSTITQSFFVHVPDPNANGMASVQALPFIEDFEDGFTLPQPHMLAPDAPAPTWQPFNAGGYASANSLYVPASDVGAQADFDLVIGNFDLRELEEPTIRFRVATSHYQMATWCRLEVHFTDLCSNIFTGNPWVIRQVNEFAVDNGAGFTPTNDGQWTLFSASFPAWNLAAAAEFKLRLKRQPDLDIFTNEALFIDDLYVGEAESIPTYVHRPQNGSTIALWPNPATESVAIALPRTERAAWLRVIDAQGAVVHTERTGPSTTVLRIGSYAPGVYLVELIGEHGRSAARFVKDAW